MLKGEHFLVKLRETQKKVKNRKKAKLADKKNLKGGAADFLLDKNVSLFL